MRFIVVVLLLFVGVLESIRHQKLTVTGAVTGGSIGLLLFIAAGWMGLTLLGIFFLLGTGATNWQRKKKEATGMAQERSGRRTAGQVLANGGVAGLLAILSLLYPIYSSVLVLMIAGSFSSALADTLSSELGTLYGKQYYNILTFKKDRKGLDGVVSLEGSIIGLVGSCFIAAVYSIGMDWSIHFFWIVIAGTIGNLTDSILGAGLERQKRINNDVVNCLNTVAGSLTALLLSLF